jgi:hypothetical protein
MNDRQITNNSPNQTVVAPHPATALFAGKALLCGVWHILVIYSTHYLLQPTDQLAGLLAVLVPLRASGYCCCCVLHLPAHLAGWQTSFLAQ